MPNENNENIKRSALRGLLSWCAFLFFTVVLVALDQWLKVWTLANLARQPKRTLINGVLGLTYHRNPGAALGFLADFSWGRWVITGMVVVLLPTVLWYYHKLPHERKNWLVRVPLILIFAGGLGNLTDRFFRGGFVVDMLEFLFINFAIFNLADVYVTVGAFSLVFVIMLMGKNAPWPFGDTNDKPD
jgi:signal peptidase II